MPAFVAAGSPASVASGTFQGNFTAAQTVREDFGLTARMDHVFSDKDTFVRNLHNGMTGAWIKLPELDPGIFSRTYHC